MNDLTYPSIAVLLAFYNRENFLKKQFVWCIYAFVRSKKIDWYFNKKPLIYYIRYENNEIGANFGIQAFLKRFKMLISKHWFE